MGTAESMALLVDELGRAAGSAERSSLLTGIEEALRGRRQVAMPAAWPEVFAKLAADADPQVRSRAMALGLTFGDPAARASFRAILADARPTSARGARRWRRLLKVKDPSLAATLHGLVRDPGLGGPRRARAVGLRRSGDAGCPDQGLSVPRAIRAARRLEHAGGPQGLGPTPCWRRSRRASCPRGDLTADLVRQLRNLKDPSSERRIGRVWGTVRETTGDRARLIARYKAMLTSKPARAPDPSLGRAVFAKVCQQCHTLFGVGGQVGPDLTGSNRADLDYVLSNVLDPSALIGKDYLAHVIATTDGRVLTGIIRAEDKDTITLVTANETVTLPKSEVDERRPSEQSMMPDDLWKPLSEHEIRSLVSYLASPAQVPLPAREWAKAP